MLPILFAELPGISQDWPGTSTLGLVEFPRITSWRVFIYDQLHALLEYKRIIKKKTAPLPAASSSWTHHSLHCHAPQLMKNQPPSIPCQLQVHGIMARYQKPIWSLSLKALRPLVRSLVRSFVRSHCRGSHRMAYMLYACSFASAALWCLSARCDVMWLVRPSTAFYLQVLLIKCGQLHWNYDQPLSFCAVNSARKLALPEACNYQQ